jgi:pappalysin-1
LIVRCFRTVELGTTYLYSIQGVTSSGLKGSPSPFLSYTPKRGFCGDGHVDKETGEECDDGNIRDGDGCNVRCKKEDVFHCQGNSLA